MILRPVDENGDMLPALSSAFLLSGTEAIAELIRGRLSLYTGEWWENPALGNGIPDLLMSSRPTDSNGILEMFRDARLTEADGQAVSSYLSAYIRETPGVLNVRDVSFSAENRHLSYFCIVETDSDSVTINYEL